jgi:hypothetical protein
MKALSTHLHAAILKKHRRSLHYATPDFLLRLVALANFMRLSLMKAAHVVASCAAWQEIRVRSGPTARRGRRDDKSVAGRESFLTTEAGSTAVAGTGPVFDQRSG